MKYFVSSLIFYLVFFVMTADSQSQRSRINLCPNAKSDLYKLLHKEGMDVIVYKTPEQAIMHAMNGTGVFILSDSYPNHKTLINIKLLGIAKKKNLRLYIEYPASLPELDIHDTTVATNLERGVVVSDVFGENLKPMSILGINDCYVIPVNVNDPLIVLGKVAGFNNAVYGINNVKCYPLLFQKENMLVAMTRLSNFAMMRYGPSKSWRVVWQYILSWITRNKSFRLHHWLSYVSPMYERNQHLSQNAVRTSILKGVKWFFNGHFFIDSSWENMYLKYQGDGTNPYGPPVNSHFPNGDGSLGILEGHASHIFYNGTQQYRYWVRADVQGEVAYALAATGNFLNKKSYDKIASNLADFVFYHSDLRAGPKNNKQSSAFGLIGWSVTNPGIFYGDDNARFILGLIGAEAYMKTHRWDQKIAEAIMANFRTTGREGFRGDFLEQDSIVKDGWKHFWSRDVISPHPHFESWMWACYLWLYNKTGYEPLLKKTENAIRITMQYYQGKWLWTNGIQQERARMILPLAWLVRIDDTPEHRKWLNEVVSDLLKNQVTCGAIREELGDAKNGMYGPPKSNQAYGTNEAPLIFKNGDPVADMLYTNNFAFFSLNEAAHVTKNKRYMAAVQKLARFLIRIQVKSDRYKDLDGSWFRAFDYGLWDYWASNSDAGWGAWATLTGWIQSWIVTTEVLVERNQSYWALTKNSTINEEMPQTIKAMFGSGAK